MNRNDTQTTPDLERAYYAALYAAIDALLDLHSAAYARDTERAAAGGVDDAARVLAR